MLHATVALHPPVALQTQQHAAMDIAQQRIDMLRKRQHAIACRPTFVAPQPNPQVANVSVHSLLTV